MGRFERGEINITLEKTYEFAKVLDVDFSLLLPNFLILFVIMKKMGVIWDSLF